MNVRDLSYLLQFRTGVAPRFSSAEKDKIEERLFNEGLISYKEGAVEATERGLVYLEAVLSVPLPVQQTQWVIPKE